MARDRVRYMARVRVMGRVRCKYRPISRDSARFRLGLGLLLGLGL
jgi:hypothetical protein